MSSTTIDDYIREIDDVCTDPQVAKDALRQLASQFRQLQRATVFYRFLLGRQLIGIKQNQLWLKMERRDYRNDPNGIPLWDKNENNRFHASWYNFIEEGFEYITGLHRETAYSAIKLAESTTLSSLPLKELQNFTRLANAMQIVVAERRGLKITSDLIQKARHMTIREFRQTIRPTVSETRRSNGGPRPNTNRSRPSGESSMINVIGFFKVAAARNLDAVNNFWEALHRAMLNANNDPVGALETITRAYLAVGHEQQDSAAQRLKLRPAV
jgi:hypothetical protein